MATDKFRLWLITQLAASSQLGENRPFKLALVSAIIIAWLSMRFKGTMVVTVLAIKARHPPSTGLSPPLNVKFSMSKPGRIHDFKTRNERMTPCAALSNARGVLCQSMEEIINITPTVIENEAELASSTRMWEAAKRALSDRLTAGDFKTWI